MKEGPLDLALGVVKKRRCSGRSARRLFSWGGGAHLLTATVARRNWMCSGVRSPDIQGRDLPGEYLRLLVLELGLRQDTRRL